MDPVINLAPLLVALAGRQAAEHLARRDVPAPTQGAGRDSIVLWYLAYLVILMLALSHAWSTPWSAQAWWGYALWWGGCGLRLAALRAIGGYYDYLIVVRENHRLVDTGPYRRLRHPLHLGLHLEMAGLAVIGESALAWVALALSLIALLRRNLQEERALEAHFGAPYRAYRRATWDVVDLLPRRRRDRRCA